MSEKISIIAISPNQLTSPRGTPLRVFKLLESLSQKDEIELRLFTRDEESPIKNTEHHYVEQRSFTILREVLKSNKKRKADIIICHTLGLSVVVFFLKILTRSKIVLELHGFIADEAFAEGTIGRTRFLLNSCVHRLIFYISDLVTTCSYTATEIVSKYNKRSVTIISGANTKMFSPEVGAKYDFKESPHQIVIGYAGNTRSWQGLDFLIECLIELNSYEPKKYRLALLLNGIVREDFKSRSDVVVLQPLPYTEVSAFLASCDCLVIPRNHSYVNKVSFPSKLIEYLAMGKPVIASKTSDMHKIIVDKKSGLLYEPGDKNDFIQSIKLLEDEKFRDSLSEEARDLVLKKYSWETQIDMFLVELKKTINNV